MREAKDTLFRQFAPLRLIPLEPPRLATTTLLEELREEGFSLSLRTLQRDLESLPGPFALLCDTQEVPHRWNFARNSPVDFAVEGLQQSERALDRHHRETLPVMMRGTSAS